MKKKCIIFAAALCVALSACERQGARESALPVTAVPTAAVSATQTIKPTAAPTPVATAEPTALHTQEPAATPAPTPVPTPRVTAPKASAEPTAPVLETPVPEATPPIESSALPPEPTESLCALPLAPTPKPEGTEPPAVTDTPAPSENPQPTVGPSEAPTPTAPPSQTPAPVHPTDEEVLAAYQAANEAYGWFDLYTLPLDYAAPSREKNGQQYQPVADERFSTMDALRGYLKGLFSDEVVDRLLPIDGEHYAEIDGVLCAMDGARGTDVNSGPVTKTVIWPEEGGGNLCTVHVEVELLWEDENYPEGKRAYDFPYQKVGDKWVFTQFESIM